VLLDQGSGLDCGWYVVNGSEQDGNIRSGCMEDEGIDCEDGVSDTDWYR